MKYSFQIYFKYHFWIPLIGVIFLLCFCIFDIVHLVKYIKNGQTKSISYYFFAVLVSTAILFVFLGALVRGIPLLSDKNVDTQFVSGKVTDIKYSFYAARYYLDGRVCRGVWVNIGDQKYYMIDTGKISIGDDVQIRYLPHSHFVMECDKE